MERQKYRYHLAFQCTKNGHFRANMTYYVNASSEAEAKRLVKESYPDAKAFRIIGKWENTPRKTNNANAKESTATTKKVNSAPKAAESCGAGRKTSDVPHVEPEEIIRSIWNKRKAEMRKLQEQLEANYSRNLSRLTSECEAKRTKLNKELDRTKKTIEEKAAYRKTVGLFQFEKQKSIKREREYTAASKEDFIVNIFNYKSHGYTVTKCFRRRIYDENVIWFPPLGMHEDIYLMSQIIFYAGSIVHLPEVLYHYRKDNPGSFCSQDRKKRHIASTTNLLDLYIHYRENLKGSPIEKVAGGILMRAGQHSMLHGYDFFSEYPFLAEDIVKTKISFRYRTSVLVQIAVKIYALFRK